MRHLESEIIPTTNNKTRQHTHAVPQQGRIPWLMNVGLDAGAVRTHFPPLLDALLLGISQDFAIDHLPGSITYDFDVSVQGGFFKPLVSHTDTAEPAQALRVNDVKYQNSLGKWPNSCAILLQQA